MAKLEVTAEEVTFIVDGGATTFSLGDVIRTVITSDESIETALVVDRDSGTATAGLVETPETLTLDELRPTSIAEIIEAIEPSTGAERLTNDTETSVTDISSEGDSDTAVTASEAEVVDEEPGAAIEVPDVDGYTVYVPVSDSDSVSEAMPLAA